MVRRGSIPSAAADRRARLVGRSLGTVGAGWPGASVAKGGGGPGGPIRGGAFVKYMTHARIKPYFSMCRTNPLSFNLQVYTTTIKSVPVKEVTCPMPFLFLFRFRRNR